MDVAGALPAVGSPELSDVTTAVPLATLESSDAIIYATDPELRLIYVNPAWDKFAVANVAPYLIRSHLTRNALFDAIRGPLRDFYADRFSEALRTAKPIEHTFECSSADLYRRFQMRILPLRNQGFLVINTLTVEEPMPHTGVPASPEYLDTDRLITMCSHCRRTQRPGTGVWDWVPGFVRKQPEHVTHGLCPVCLEYHYVSRKRHSAR